MGTLWEYKEITESTTGVAELDGNGATWTIDVWNLTVPYNQKHTFSSNDVFSCKLVGDDAAEMPAQTLVRVVKRDEDTQEMIPLLNTLYQNCKAFTDVAKLQHLNIKQGQTCTVLPGQHIAVMVNGIDVATSGDVDASASNFRLTSQRERTTIL